MKYIMFLLFCLQTATTLGGVGEGKRDVGGDQRPSEIIVFRDNTNQAILGKDGKFIPAPTNLLLQKVERIHVWGLIQAIKDSDESKKDERLTEMIKGKANLVWDPPLFEVTIHIKHEAQKILVGEKFIITNNNEVIGNPSLCEKLFSYLRSKLYGVRNDGIDRK
jgi:hypothetical protein